MWLWTWLKKASMMSPVSIVSLVEKVLLTEKRRKKIRDAIFSPSTFRIISSFWCSFPESCQDLSLLSITPPIPPLLLSPAMPLSNPLRLTIVKLHEKGKSNAEIARLLEIHPSTVANILRLYMETGKVEPRQKAGRPSKVTLRDERKVVLLARKDPSQGAVSIANELSATKGKKISPETVRRALHRAGLHGRKMARKPALSSLGRKLRLNFAKTFVAKDPKFWDTVIFSDESAFEIFQTKKKQWVWRKPGERYQEDFISPRKKFGGGKIHLWGCFTSQGIGFLCHLPEGLDSETYLTILEEELLHTSEYYFGKRENFTLVQDGASCHTARQVRGWFKQHRIEVLPFPANSPDLNPIENLWAELKKRVAEKHPHIANKEQLWEAIEEEYETIPTEYCKHLAESMPARLQAVIDAKGGPTKY